ncbi:hypothetical protein [Ureibacillus sp. GCM10028918]|uniref:hypothetical protein n=1 Tax=Ureibacillus sp. GCM10028918 TaxID=3273429 RepID=UPI0036208F05
MAEMLGISKKTLVQIEKGRTPANWTTVIAFCALFNDSELLLSVIGDKPIYLIRLIANKEDTPKEKTMGCFGGRKLLKKVIYVCSKM